MGSCAATSSGWFAASGGRHALLFPLAGEEKKSVEQQERHELLASLAGAGGIL
jgi:hypothetical protein